MNHGKISGQRSPGRKSSRCKDLEGGMTLADGSNRQEREEHKTVSPRDKGTSQGFVGPEPNLSCISMRAEVTGKKDLVGE